MQWTSLFSNFNLQNKITKSTQTTTNSELSKGLKVIMPLFISHTEVELFETDNNKRDIFCAKNINTKIIECSEIIIRL